MPLTDEDIAIINTCVLIYQNTALHFAAKGGHVAAVKLMLSQGAELVLNKNDTSFLHEALQNGRIDVVNAVIDSNRYIFNTTVQYSENTVEKLSIKSFYS